MNLYQPTITGSLSVSGSVNISGSISIAGGGTISGTASIATTALTASFVANAQTASYVLNAVSSSFALTASSADNFLTRGTLTAQTLVVQTITSSVSTITGSTNFGSLLANTHAFTGSVLLSSGSSIGLNTYPTYPLDIYTSVSSSANIQAQFFNDNYGSGVRNFIRVRNGIGVGSTYSSYFGQGSNGKTYIVANDLSRNDLVIDGNSGYVGIGTINPATILDANGSLTTRSPGSTGAWYLKDTSGNNKYEIGWETTTNALYFYSYLTNTSVLRISGSSIGINITTPLAPLHVAASARVALLGVATNNVRLGNDGGGTYLEQYGTTSATSGLRLQSSKAGNETDYTTVSIDPYSGLNVTKSGTGGNNVFASGVPIQVVYGAAIASSGPQGTGVSLGTACNGDTPSSTQGIQIASVSFTPKKANSLILIQTNSVAMWERTNLSDHFYLWAANATDSTVLVKAGQYLQNFGSGGQNGGIVCLQGIAASWGTDTKTISFRIGSTGGGANYEYNPYYNVGGFSNATVGNFTYVITEIGQ